MGGGGTWSQILIFGSDSWNTFFGNKGRDWIELARALRSTIGSVPETGDDRVICTRVIMDSLPLESTYVYALSCASQPVRFRFSSSYELNAL